MLNNVWHFLFKIKLFILENVWLPPILVLVFLAKLKDLLFLHSHKPCKNTFVLVGTVLSETIPRCADRS